MDLKEAAIILGMKREQVREAIETGIALDSAQRIKLNAVRIGRGYDIDDTDLDCFISELEKTEPGRHPPVSVCRCLLVEARHRCAICRESAFLHYHHIIEWSRVKKHDPAHMMVLCGTCHDKCHNEAIDSVSQRNYKRQLSNTSAESIRSTTNEEVAVEVKLNQDFEHFTHGKRQRFLEALGALLDVTDEIKVIAQKKGCVRLTIRLPRDKAETLLALAGTTCLDELGVLDVRMIDPEFVERTSTTGRKPWDRDGIGTLDDSESFSETSWDLIFDAKREKDETRRKAYLSDLIEIYWRPVYHYIKRKGYGHEAALDLTQGFMSYFFLEAGIFKKADSGKGKFRALLLVAVNRYIINERRDRARREGRVTKIDSDDLIKYIPDTIKHEPGHAFDHAFAADLLNKVLNDVKNEYCSTGRDEHWELFRLSVLEPAFQDRTRPRLSELCEKLDIRNEQSAVHMIAAVKRRFRAILNRYITHHSSTEADATEALKEIRRLFSD